jgi:hypothetical protein
VDDIIAYTMLENITDEKVVSKTFKVFRNQTHK